MLNFDRVRSKEQTLRELAAGLTVTDLHRLTDEMIDVMSGLIADATDADVVFVPVDPAANDRYAARAEDVSLAWTLGHVIVHTTASGEEAGAISSELARGVQREGRSRAETPWETVQTVAQLRARLEESRRIRHAYLSAWPDQPHLDLAPSPYPGAEPMNAVVRYVFGLSHDDSHLGQISEIVRQARMARAATSAV
jgi:hypothetical protein